MRTLLEEMMKRDRSNADTQEETIIDALDKAVCFKIDNVSSYYFSQSDQEEWDLDKDFPNIAPPFEYFFMEFDFPEKINSEGKITEFPVSGKCGALFKSKLIPDGVHTETSIKPCVKWVYAISVFSKINGENQIRRPNAWMAVGVDENGRFSLLKENDPGPLFSFYDERTANMSRETMNWFMMITYPAFLAISFLHCRNVAKIEHDPAKITGRKRRHSPKVKFYTLEIDPMKKILETEGNSGVNGIKKALHICRGHFKTYEGKGLFGKYQGTYWWSDQVRGKIENGIVEKDYSISPSI